jgi:hypothetical protein
MEKQIAEVHFYQGVKFGNSVIKFISLDSAFSDARLRKGDEAFLMDIGVRVLNHAKDEEIIVPFNNVSFIKLVKNKVESAKQVEVKKVK